MALLEIIIGMVTFFILSTENKYDTLKFTLIALEDDHLYDRILCFVFTCYFVRQYNFIFLTCHENSDKTCII